ncbi:MAG: hypothetical protein KBT36_14825 [Kurthia sp.]|nr:hypothetical protein [Candidatus Kurthia equi]
MFDWTDEIKKEIEVTSRKLASEVFEGFPEYAIKQLQLSIEWRCEYFYAAGW